MAAPPSVAHQDDAEPAAFPPEEEAALLRESHAIKAEANGLFAARDYDNALARYHDALASCPKYLGFERAVLQSNMAAAHLQLEQWGEAIKAATDALDALAGLDEPAAAAAADDEDDSVDGSARETPAPPALEAGNGGGAPRPAADDVAPRPAADDVARIRTKALLRRARARSEAGGWQHLSGAEEDYRALAAAPGLAPADARAVRAQLRALPPRARAAQEAETAEMWGKLRQLGDGILKPFGLSTQNFQMVQDEKTGGYSVNFSQGGGGGGSSS